MKEKPQWSRGKERRKERSRKCSLNTVLGNLFVIPQMIELVDPPGEKQTLKNFVLQMLQYYAISFERLDTIGTKGCWLNLLIVLY